MTIRVTLLRLGWIVGTLVLIGHVAFFLYNHNAPVALMALSAVGGILVGLYGILVLSEPSETHQRRGRRVLSLILVADLVLFVEALGFVLYGVEPIPPREIAVTYIWDEKTGEVFLPKPEAPFRVMPNSYIDFMNRIVRRCASEKLGSEVEEQPMHVPAACGLLPGHDLAEAAILAYLGHVHQYRWEAQPKRLPRLFNERASRISKYIGDGEKRLLNRDGLINMFPQNKLVRFLDEDFRLSLPPDVTLRPILKGDVHGGLYFNGLYCDVWVKVLGGSAGATIDEFRRTNTDIHLQAICSNFHRGHSNMKSRIAWATQLMDTIETEFSNVQFGAKP